LNIVIDQANTSDTKLQKKKAKKQMGQFLSKKLSLKNAKASTKPIGNQYESMPELTKALRKAGLEKCNLLVAIDFTKSNNWQGEKTFRGKCLHEICPMTTEGGYEPVAEAKGTLNPYQYVLQTAQKPLNEFDEDKLIPTCIFGHARKMNDPYVLEIFDSPDEKVCHGLEGVLAAYEQAVNEHGFSGGTLFGPVLDWAHQKVYESQNEYHILIILGDGNIDDMKETQNKLQQISSHTPLSIIFVGVGDGSDPENRADKWCKMRELDDAPTGSCDIWQSVYLANIQAQLDKSQHPDVDLATMMLMEIPEQYLYFQKHGLIRK